MLQSAFVIIRALRRNDARMLSEVLNAVTTNYGLAHGGEKNRENSPTERTSVDETWECQWHSMLYPSGSWKHATPRFSRTAAPRRDQPRAGRR